ncbi:Uncharacterised protein [uncultured archaeon]|nr:Uncharacterised protein [uncultured archaeon]
MLLKSILLRVIILGSTVVVWGEKLCLPQASLTVTLRMQVVAAVTVGAVKVVLSACGLAKVPPIELFQVMV